MPGRLFLTRNMRDVAQALGAQGVALTGVEPDLDISPGSEIIVMDERLRLRRMRWGILPVGKLNARKRPVMEPLINARSETVFDKSVYEGVRRAVVPADGWYEWTGEVHKKTRWRIHKKSRELIVFAAIYEVWEGPGGVRVPQVATLTCPPNKEVRAVHHRMGVILPPAQIRPWLEGEKVPLGPAPSGSLLVKEAVGIDPYSKG